MQNFPLYVYADELRRDYRKLQQDNLQLKQERQHLLEKVVRLEKKASKNSPSEVVIIIIYAIILRATLYCNCIYDVFSHQYNSCERRNVNYVRCRVRWTMS